MEQPRSVEDAVVTLQTESKPAFARIGALRYLRNYVTTSTSKSNRSTVSKINRLITDTVTRLALTEEGIVNTKENQMLKAECFLILSQILETPSVFDDARKRIDDISAIADDSSTITSSDSSMQRREDLKYIHLDRPNSPLLDRPLSPLSMSTTGDDVGGISFSKQTPSKSLLSMKGKNKNNKTSIMSKSLDQEMSDGQYVRNALLNSSDTMDAGGQHPPSQALENGDEEGEGRRSTMASDSLYRTKSVGKIHSVRSLFKDKLLPKVAKSFVKQARFLPRSSMMMGDKYEQQKIIPGEKDHNNWLNVDKKLGYQKARMWFPLGNVAATPKLLPDDRSKVLKSDQVVQEFLQMKALVSYVGDVVNVPKRFKLRHVSGDGGDVIAQHIQKQKAEPLGVHVDAETLRKGITWTELQKRAETESLGEKIGTRSETTVLDSSTYNKAMEEVKAYWEPLIGACLPSWAKPKVEERDGDDSAKELERRQELLRNDPTNPEAIYGEHIYPVGKGKKRHKSKREENAELASREVYVYDKAKQSAEVDAMERSVIICGKALEQLLDNESGSTVRTKETLRNTLRTLLNHTHNDDIPDLSESKLQGMQKEIAGALDAEQVGTKRTLKGIDSLMVDTVVYQYHTLPPRYILEVEKNDKSSREIVQRMFDIFVRVKRANLLGLAMGLWKVCLVQGKIESDRIRYSKAAGVQLMMLFFKHKIIRRKSQWFERWYWSVMWTTYKERSTAALKIQTRVRVWRDRQIFMRLHLVAPYNGPLSDLYLAEWRGERAKFKIDRSIRESRRMFWLAVVVVQARYRGLLARRWYYQKIGILILIQSVCRMWPVRVWFRDRLKPATTFVCARVRRFCKRKIYKRWKFYMIIIQKYVRRFVYKMLYWHKLHAIWRLKGVGPGLAIWLQCRWREKVAIRKCEAIRHEREQRERAALRLQCVWMTHKKAFHTFLLMSCYRSMNQIEKLADFAARKLGRNVSARLVERFYKRRHYYRMHSNANKIQSWYRGVKGYNAVMLIRLVRWASRKLHHWARCRMRFRHKCVRMVQRLWWDKHPGNLMKHLHRRMRLIDKQRDEIIWEERYVAACRIQAILKGILTRIWLRNDIAVRKIQGVAKFWLFRRKCKRELAARLRRFTTKWTKNILDPAVKLRTLEIVAYHHKKVKPIQALIRGALIRSTLERSRQFAKRYGRAVITIQRFWRASNAMVKAVQELLMIKRMDENPFKPCETIHTLCKKFKGMSEKFFTTRDARAGMKTVVLLQRLGYPDFIKIFNPIEDYRNVTQLKKMTEEKYMKLFDKWDKQRIKAENAKKPVDMKEAKKERKLTVEEKFRLAEMKNLAKRLVQIVSPEVVKENPYVTISKNQKLSQNVFKTPSILAHEAVSCVTEFLSPKELKNICMRLFLAKFGKSRQVNATNFSDKMVEIAFGSYNNFRQVINKQLLTLSMIERAVELSKSPSDVRGKVEEFLAVPLSSDEIEWEKERILKAEDVCELATERMLAIVEEGPVKRIVDRYLKRKNQFTKKFEFVVKHNKELALKQRIEEMRKAEDKKRGIKPSKEEIAQKKKDSMIASQRATLAAKYKKSKNRKGDDEDEKMFEFELITSKASERLTVLESLELPFSVNDASYSNIERNISVCKLLFELMDKLEKMTSRVQSLKTMWGFKLQKTKVERMKAKKFLEDVLEEYKADRHKNRVKIQWEKIQKLRQEERAMSLLFDQIAAKKSQIEEMLLLVPRYGWYPVLDKDQQTNWTDGSYHSSEKPVYSFEQYSHILKIQNFFRNSIKKMRDRIRRKEEQRLADLKAIEDEWAAALLNGQRLIKFKIRMMERREADRESLACQENENNRDENDTKDSNSNNNDNDQNKNTNNSKEEPVLSASSVFKEELLPYRLRFEERPTWKTGDWCIMASDDDQEYMVVTVFKLQKAQRGDIKCDVRNVKGKKFSNISVKRLFRMNLDVGSKVEVRYKSMKLFYRGKVTAVHSIQQKLHYHILYDDGECEYNVDRSMIRSTADAVSSFMSERNKIIQEMDKQLQRKAHFQHMKETRFLRMEKEKKTCLVGFSEAWMEATNQPISENPLIRPWLPPLQEVEQPTKKSIENSKGGQLPSPSKIIAAKNNANGGSPDSKALHPNKKANKGKNRATTPVQETRPDPKPADTLLRMMDFSNRIGYANVELTCGVKYIRISLRYGWVAFQEDEMNLMSSEEKEKKLASGELVLGGKKKYVEAYRNFITNEVTIIPPTYTPVENYGAKRFQMLFGTYKAKKHFRALIERENIPSVIEQTLHDYQQVAWIGYRLEGLTTLQILRRAGAWEVALRIEQHFKGRPAASKFITLPYIANLQKKNYSLIGLNHQDDAHSTIIDQLISFQRFYKKSTPAQFEASLGLMNYFKSPTDNRNIIECVQQSELQVYRKFEKSMASNLVRAKNIAKAICQSSKFPHARRQIDEYVKRYDGKPGMAQDNIDEVCDVPVTHTYIEEREAFKIIRRGVRVIGSVLHNLKMKNTRKRVAQFEAQADLMVASIDDRIRRSLGKIPGKEAQAALLLRVEVIEYLLDIMKNVTTIQTFLRCRSRRRYWVRYIAKRNAAIELIGRVGRGYNARKVRDWYKIQQMSVVEQLYDERRKLMYYYHTKQRFSTYNEPEDGIFRPLVREWKTQRLIQSWPFLDEQKEKVAPPPESAPGTFQPPKLCQLCNTRTTVRVCLDCLYYPLIDENVYSETAVPTAYCFICFSAKHASEPELREHRFHDATGVDPAKANVLMCVECEDQPATRKCQGIVDDRQIDEIITDLQRHTSREWMNVLMKFNVGGERKLSLMLEQIAGSKKDEDTGKILLSLNQLQQVRNLLERTRAECDEVYCDDCYLETHQHGKRAMHKWIGFHAYAPPCKICYRSPCEVFCKECDSMYCKSCFKVFHTKGRKRKHAMEYVLEQPAVDPETGLAVPHEYCGVCTRRLVTHYCENAESGGCPFSGCNSCYECVHKGYCQFIPEEVEKPYFECVVCSERADQQCVQCKDYYCSTTWMGNPGCFAKMHKKGNRVDHTTQDIDPALEAAKAVEVRRKQKEIEAKRKELEAAKKAREKEAKARRKKLERAHRLKLKEAQRAAAEAAADDTNNNL